MPSNLPPTRQQLDAVLRAKSGMLEETPYPILLLALAAGETTGTLALRRNQLEKAVIFDGGSPVECRSNIATETLGRFLVSGGKVSEQDCHAAFALAAARGVPLGEILTERKLLAPTELYRALQQNLGRKLLEPFSWKEGTWAISNDTPPIASVLRVKVPQLLVTGIAKVETQEIADAAAAIAEEKYLVAGLDPLFGLDDVRLTRDQQRVVDAARHGVSFDEIRKTPGIDSDDLNRLVYALLLLGALEVTSEPRRETPHREIAHPFATETEIETPLAVPIETVVAEPSPAGAPAAHRPVAAAPQPAVAAPAPPLNGRPAATAEEVMSAYLSYRRKDAFDLLGIAETEGAVPITRAFLQISEKFLPANFDESAADGLCDKAQEVFLASARAYAELADPERREALVKRREKLREQAAVAAQAGPSALIDPEALCKSGRTLAAAGKMREALSSFEMASECDVQNGTYAAEAAWCRYQLRNTPASTALKLLKNAIRIDPSSGVAYLYAGQVQATLGHRLEAQAYLGRAATLLPGDPRPATAMKAMQR
jgi:hypothetical protein